MAKELSVNEWKYLFKNYEKYRSGNSLKNVFEWNDEKKNVNTFLTINERD